jgi:hypothetical protein
LQSAVLLIVSGRWAQWDLSGHLWEVDPEGRINWRTKEIRESVSACVDKLGRQSMRGLQL